MLCGRGVKVIRFILTIKLIMKSFELSATSSVKKNFCVIMVFMASLVAFGQQPFEGKIVYTVNTTSRGVYKMFSDLQGVSEEVVYITNDKFIIMNVAAQLINFIDLKADAVYVACPPINMMQKTTVSHLIETTDRILNNSDASTRVPSTIWNLIESNGRKTSTYGGFMKKFSQWMNSEDIATSVDNYPAVKYSYDTTFTVVVGGSSYDVSNNAFEICLKNFLSPELLKAYSCFYGMPYYEHTSDMKIESPAPLLTSIRYVTRSVKSMEQMTPEASVFTIPSDFKVVSLKEFEKAYNKYMKGLNKTREKAGTSVEYTVPEDIWDF